MGVPGTRRFRDAHTHLAAGAADLLDLDLRGVQSVGKLSAAIARVALTVAPRDWIRGWGWDGVMVPEDDALAHPVFLARRDGHAAWINRAGRAALGLASENAVVGEERFDAIRRRLPEPSTAERMSALRPHLADLVAHGIDTVDDMVEPWAPQVYARLRDVGELPVAIGLWLPEGMADSDAKAVLREFPGDDPRLAVRGIKIFLDGTLQFRTAALSSPYADDPGTSGELRVAPGEIHARVARWAERGWCPWRSPRWSAFRALVSVPTASSTRRSSCAPISRVLRAPGSRLRSSPAIGATTVRFSQRAWVTGQGSCRIRWPRS
jgi:predicted amidohydrolase YtcJ